MTRNQIKSLLENGRQSKHTHTRLSLSLSVAKPMAVCSVSMLVAKRDKLKNFPPSSTAEQKREREKKKKKKEEEEGVEAEMRDLLPHSRSLLILGSVCARKFVLQPFHLQRMLTSNLFCVCVYTLTNENCLVASTNPSSSPILTQFIFSSFSFSLERNRLPGTVSVAGRPKIARSSTCPSILDSHLCPVCRFGRHFCRRHEFFRLVAAKCRFHVRSQCLQVDVASGRVRA